MSDNGSSERPGGSAEVPVGERGTRDVLFRTLGHARRRRILAYLRDQDRAVPVEHVATHVATAETSGTDDAAATEVETSLYHVHLPKLIDAGLVEWVDADRRAAVRPTALGASLPTALEWVPPDLRAGD